jgi:hypothetical protein
MSELHIQIHQTQYVINKEIIAKGIGLLMLFSGI